MRVLVTGGAGFVGSHIVERLVAEGDEVLVVDNLSTGREANLRPEARLEVLDIADPAIVGLAASFRPNVVSHCAAQASVPGSMARPIADGSTNIIGGINVCQAAIRSGCDQFVYINTGGALYGEPEYLPCDEDHPTRPTSAYGLSKLTMESYLRILLPATVPLKVLRLANVYGPRQDPNGEAGVVAIFGLRMLRREPLSIYGDGEQTRDFVYVGDVAEAHELAHRADEPATVNIGSGVATSVKELFRTMAGETGYDLGPAYEPEREGDVKHVVLDSTRAKEQLGWGPRTSLRDGIRETLAWLRKT